MDVEELLVLYLFNESWEEEDTREYPVETVGGVDASKDPPVPSPRRPPHKVIIR